SRQVLICGHAYHSDCLKTLNFIYLPCTRYFCDGIKKLSQSFIDRLSKGISEDSLILKEEDDGITDEDNDMFEDEISENILAQEKFFYSLSLF
ncbi:11005_t:CDS:1, partial [Funneliformis geosporum]